MGALTSTLTVHLNDDVSGPANKAAGALHKLGASGSDLKKLAAASPDAAKLVRELEQLQAQASKLQAFKDASRGLGVAGNSYRAAKQNVALLTADLAKQQAALEELKGVKGKEDARQSLAGTIRSIRRELSAAKGTLSESREAFREQGVAVRGMRTELLGAGVELGAFNRHSEKALGRTLNLGKALSSNATAVARVTRELTRQSAVTGARPIDAIAAGMGTSASGHQIRERSASRRMIDGMGASSRGARDRAESEARASAEREESAARHRDAARDAQKMILGGAGLVVGHQVAERKKEVLEVYKEFDDLRRYQVAVADLSEEESDSRVKQALHLGASTRFNDLQVLHAQLDLAQRGVKKEFIEPFVGEIVNYAQAMNTDLGSAAKTLEGIVFSTGQDVEDPATAQKTMRRNVDMAVKMAKIGGLDNEDVKEAFKFGGPSGSVAGLSNPTMGAIFALLRRSGFAGSEAGVATRALSSKLVSPTNKGLGALAAMGLNYNDYVTMPLGNRPEVVESAFKSKFGKGFSIQQRQKMDDLINNPDIFGDQQKFIEGATAISSSSFEKNKKGKMKVTDQKALAKVFGSLWSNMIESVNSEKLFHDILAANPTLAQSNALFTDKHGGKIAILAKKAALFDEYVEKLQHVKEGTAKEVGDKRNAGYAGAAARYEGSQKNLDSAIGQAIDNDGKGGALTQITDMSARVVQALAELPKPALAAGSALAYIGGKASSLMGAALVTGTATGITAAIATGSGAIVASIATAIAGVLAPVTLTAAIAAALLSADKNKGLVHGGKDVEGAQSPSDVLPGVPDAAQDKSNRMPSLPPGWGDSAAVRSAPGFVGPNTGASRAAEGVPSLIDQAPQGRKGRIAKAREDLAAYARELEQVKSELAGQADLGLPGLGDGLEKRKAELEGLVDGLLAKLKSMGEAPIAPKFDASGAEAFGTTLDGVKTKAQEAGQMKVDIPVSLPGGEAAIGTLSRIIELAAQAKSAMGGLGGGGGGNSGRVRQAQTDNH